MTYLDDVADQLADQLNITICGSLDAIGALDLAALTRARIAETAPRLAAALCGDDDHLAAQTVIDLVGIGWDADPDPEWWRTPVGLAVARSVGGDDVPSVSQSVAAAMIGVATGTVKSALSRGESTLQRHPDGGITRTSVLAEIRRRYSDQDR